MLTSSRNHQLGGFFDDLVSSVSGEAVASATAAAQPLISEVEGRLRAIILPVAFFTAGSFLISLLTYREVRRGRSK